MPKYSKKDVQESLKSLRNKLKPGDEVITILRHVSSTGMARDISLFIVHNGQMEGITYDVSRVLGYALKDSHGSNAIRVTGCDMDMGFSTVYNLSRVLFPDGFGVAGEGLGKFQGKTIRPVNKAEAQKFAGKVAKFSGRNRDESGWDDDGGYALKQRWL